MRVTNPREDMMKENKTSLSHASFTPYGQILHTNFDTDDRAASERRKKAQPRYLAKRKPSKRNSRKKSL